MIVIKVDISKLIIIIEFILAPAQIIINGPRATLGREFKIVKNGEKTFDKNLFHQRRVAINRDMIDEIRKLSSTSYKVIKMFIKLVNGYKIKFSPKLCFQHGFK